MPGIHGVPREHPRQGPGQASPGRRALRRLANSLITAADIAPGVLPGAGSALRPLYANPTAVSNSGTGETDLMSYTLPGGTLANIGDAVFIDACITLSGGAATKTIKFYFGVLQFSLVFAAATVNTFYIRICIMRVDGTDQQICAGITEATSVAGTAGQYVAGTQTLSASQVIKFTGTSSVGSNQVTQQMMNVQLSQP